MKDLMHKSAGELYDTIYKKYHDNRAKAANDFNELPAVLKTLGSLKGKKILDMGCGLGHHSKEFMKRGGIVTGYDASEKMIQLTKKYCGNDGEFFQSTHEAVQFRNNMFDICNASFSVNYSKNLDIIFKKVHKWLKPGGIFTFSIPHPVMLFERVDKMDYSKSHKILIKLNTYQVKIFNYYHPLDVFIQVINKNNFKLMNILETTIPKRYRGWREEKYRLPNANLFKIQKI